MKKYTKVEIQFENMEIGLYEIKSITDLKYYKSYNNKYIKKLDLDIFKNNILNNNTEGLGMIANTNRILKYNDITSFKFFLDDNSFDEFFVHWHYDDDEINRYQYTSGNENMVNIKFTNVPNVKKDVLELNISLSGDKIPIISEFNYQLIHLLMSNDFFDFSVKQIKNFSDYYQYNSKDLVHYNTMSTHSLNEVQNILKPLLSQYNLNFNGISSEYHDEEYDSLTLFLNNNVYKIKNWDCYYDDFNYDFFTTKLEKENININDLDTCWNLIKQFDFKFHPKFFIIKDFNDIENKFLNHKFEILTFEDYSFLIEKI